MSNKAAKRDAIIVLYEGRNTAEKAYGTLERLQEIDRVEIHTAALIYRQPNGKLKVQYRKRPGLRRGLAGGGIIGLLVAGVAAGPVLAATAAGAAIGGAIGATRDADRKALRQLLETRLGPENSALAVEIKSADWLRVRERTSHYAGEVIQLELTPDSRRELEALVEDQSLLALLEDHVEVEEGVS